MQCDQMECKQEAVGSFSAGPGTYLKLCEECLEKYEDDLIKDEKKPLQEQ